jgi:hypothetical protein
MTRIQDLPKDEQQHLACLNHSRKNPHLIVRSSYFFPEWNTVNIRLDIEVSVPRGIQMSQWIRENLPDPKERWVKEYLLNRDFPAAR